MKKKKISKLLSKHFVILTLGLSICVFSGGGYLLYRDTVNTMDTSFKGVSFNNINFSSLTKPEIEEKLNNIFNETLYNKNISFIYNDKVTTKTPKELGASVNIKELTDKIYYSGKTDNILTTILARIKLFIDPQDYSYTIDIDSETLDNFISSIDKEYSIKPQEITASFNKGILHLTDSKEGLQVDTDKLKNMVLTLSENKFNATSINIPIYIVKPKSDSSIIDSMEILGSYETKLLSSNADRTTNIKLFSKKINSTVVLPDEEFSADKQGGSRTTANGYKKAIAFVNGKPTPTVAGGICQVTSTLYNAMLYADLEILERHPHSLKVTYAENSRDAAIASGVKDLRFKNNTGNPVVIQAYVTSDGYVKTNIWGVKKDTNKEIKVRVKHLNSKSSIGYKDTYIDGKLVETKLLSRDTYK